MQSFLPFPFERFFIYSFPSIKEMVMVLGVVSKPA
uniref:Uncharacterized protein n=1 Tax=Manihot esculenta TaxID=3983 RepID=A0A2C9V7H0_MANES